MFLRERAAVSASAGPSVVESAVGSVVESVVESSYESHEVHMSQVPDLFAPFKLGPVTLRNRFIRAGAT